MTTAKRWIAGSMLAAGLVGGAATSAAADIVRLSTGALLSVESYRTEGDTAILSFSGGGELRVPTSSIASVQDDEVFHPKAGAKPISTLVVLPGPGSWSRDELRAKVDAIADQVGVDRRLAHAVVATESNYEPTAVSAKGAMGLMQLMPDVVKDFAVTNPFDPDLNLVAGLRYLRGLVSRLGVRNGLAAYNAGEATVSRYGGVPPYRETRDYVEHILGLLRR